MPPNVSALAAQYGLIWGGNWRPGYQDFMHFEWTGNPYTGGPADNAAAAIRAGRTGGATTEPGFNQATYNAAVIQIESEGRPSYGGRYQGLGQFSVAEQRRFGITDPNNLAQVNAALTRESQQFAAHIAITLGRPATAAELYLAHQQGLAGATHLLQNPNVPAYTVLPDGLRHIWRNMTREMKAQFPGGPATITSKQFIDLWTARYNEFAGAVR
jgi:hypothetical protein